MSIIRYFKVFNFEWILLKVLCLLVMALFTTLISGHNTLYNAQPLSISKINFCHCLLTQREKSRKEQRGCVSVCVHIGGGGGGGGGGEGLEIGIQSYCASRIIGTCS